MTDRRIGFSIGFRKSAPLAGTALAEVLFPDSDIGDAHGIAPNIYWAPKVPQGSNGLNHVPLTFLAAAQPCVRAVLSAEALAGQKPCHHLMTHHVGFYPK
jgi:hypothetical protein